jgi:hypothetical protein
MGFLGRASSASSSFFSFSHSPEKRGFYSEGSHQHVFSVPRGRTSRGEAGKSYGPIQWE